MRECFVANFTAVCQNWCQWVYRFIQYQCYDIIFRIVIWHQVWPTKWHIWFPKRFEDKRCASYQMSQILDPIFFPVPKNLQLSGREAATHLWWRLSAKDPGVCSGSAMLVMVVMLPWCLWHGKRSWQTQTIDEHNPPPAPPPAPPPPHHHHHHHHHHNISIMICIMTSLTSSQHVNIRGRQFSSSLPSTIYLGPISHMLGPS